ncbi:hypothetical protein E2I00_017978, partial [Balaenoptera physalus]
DFHSPRHGVLRTRPPTPPGPEMSPFLIALPAFSLILIPPAYALFFLCCPGNFICQNPTLGSESTMTEVGWWKLTFLRKKKSTPKVLYEIPDTYTQTEGGAEPPRPDGGGPNSNFNTRLEKIVDKNTKGKHVKVSNSGRFKEKKK